MSDKTHVLELEGPILAPEEGLLLGNGDLSVSIYEALGEIRFRFGKGDVWDRRTDFSHDPQPAHIDEVERGILQEGWTCGPYGGKVVAEKGTANPDRMREICQGCPPSYEGHPFPCPKPACELRVHYAGDLLGVKVHHRLLIEEAKVEIHLSSRSGVTVSIEAVIHPTSNRLSLRWALAGWVSTDQYGGSFPGLPPHAPIWFSLFRWPDPTVESFAFKHLRETRHPGFLGYANKGNVPLPCPRILSSPGRPVLVQSFPRDSVYKDGFTLAAAVHGTGVRQPEVFCNEDGAFIHLLPANESLAGELYVGLATSADGEDAAESSVAAAAGWLASESTFVEDLSAVGEAANVFWNQSAIRLGDEFLENLWYSTTHAKRCVLKAGKTPPGLFLPSTVRDYGIWHGDYHTNYNLQSVFLGDYAANHIEVGDAYFDAIKYFLPIGRQIASDFYGARGAFIQLSGYATHPAHDPIGTVPMGRMAYMTGWVAAHFFQRWLYTRDTEWLRETGYPVVRDLALFYTDFLKLGDDGRYHAFPSNQGEDGFNGKPDIYRDRAQVIRHARYCFFAASEMADVLQVDSDLRKCWQERLSSLPPEDGDAVRDEFVFSDQRYHHLPPEFLGFDGGLPPRDPSIVPGFLKPGHDFHDWYPGKIPYECSIHLRNGAWQAERDVALLIKLLRRWVHPNGLLWAMALTNYGRVGGWMESLGIVGPIQDLLLQSWTGTIEIFPGWPRSQAVAFRNLRAEGAFLVSALIEDGRVTNLTLESTVGGPARVRNPWPGSDVLINENVAACSEDGILSFPTEAAQVYRLQPNHS